MLYLCFFVMWILILFWDFFITKLIKNCDCKSRRLFSIMVKWSSSSFHIFALQLHENFFCWLQSLLVVVICVILVVIYRQYLIIALRVTNYKLIYLSNVVLGYYGNYFAHVMLHIFNITCWLICEHVIILFYVFYDSVSISAAVWKCILLNWILSQC